ncbi:MAG: alpha-2-macroglobulin [Myxococcales bacterium]|nr:alpha-2-macroglobulin [Myxococcales bacterium]
MLRRIARGLFGQVSWQPPPWLAAIGRGLSRGGSWLSAHRPATAVLLFALMLLGGVAYFGQRWLEKQPKPIEMSVRIDPPEATRLEENAKPESLRVLFGGSAAPIDRVKKPVTTGIELSPSLQGSWRWDSDRVLAFVPKEDWPVGQSFTVKLQKRGLLADDVKLVDYTLSFESAPLTGRFTQQEFYQDPSDPTQKKVVATVAFSHPIDKAELEKRLEVELVTKKDGVATNKPYRFQVTFDKYSATAYIHSDPVQIPDHDSMMVVRVQKGVKAARGGAPLKETIGTSVTIPGLYDFLRVSEASLQLVNNAQMEPEQVLVISTNTGVTEPEIKNALSVVVLPKRPPGDKSGSKEQYGFALSEISSEVLAQSRPVKIEQIPNEKEYAETHSFRYVAEVGEVLYVKVKNGMRSSGGYVLGRPSEHILSVPEFPKELRVMQTGALLAMSGERKVPLFGRDIDSVRVEIGRVLPSQLQHLISQNTGSFQNPDFSNYRFTSDNITERFSDEIEMPSLGHGKAQYAAVNLGKYFDRKGESRLGLFFLKVEGWDPKKKEPTGQSDQRLILLTDLGVLVKDNVDHSHDVFVQSLKTGDPIKGATVEVIGKNGVAIQTATTDAEGHASFPKLSDFVRERAPLAYQVSKGADLSFLPYGRHDRYLDFSRFPIDGIHDAEKPQGLQAFLFSDRGIYRPGDEIRVGLIVKSQDWKQKLSGVPLELSIDDARGVTVRKEKIRLSDAGFEEIRHQTLEASATGTWNVNVHIVKDGQVGGLLGSVAVRVQEFLPDRLKISTRLSKESVEGWVSPEGLKARVQLQNLFGTPAENRRVKATLMLSPTLPSFSKFREYQFYDPAQAKEPLTENLEEGETSEKGEAEFELPLSRFASATYRLRFVAQGFEAEGGRSVAAETQVTVSPMSYLLGYKPDGDLGYLSKSSRRSVHLVAVGPQGTSIAQSGIRTLLFERRFLSVLVKQDNGTYRYESVKKELLIEDKKLSLPSGGMTYPLPTQQPGDYFLVLKNDKDQVLNRIEFSVAGEGNLTRSLEKNAELQLKLKNPDVSAGEELEMQIKAPYTGAGLITIERDRVRAYKWFHAKQNASIQKITVPEDMEGNGYVSVSFIRGIDSQEVFMAPLTYGVAPFSISKEKRTAKISVTTPDLVKPGEPFKLRYHTDRPTKIVLWAVDEGILQVARYQTPDPLAYFFQKRALEVKTAQILDLILPEFSRLLRAAPGGDGDGSGLKNLNPFKRRRDKPVAYWSGIIDADSDDKEVTYQVPDSFNGTLRVMAVAVAPDAVGVWSKKALVRGDFVLSPNVPTVVAPGDEFEVSVGVANNVAGSGANAKVTVQLQTSKHLQVTSEGAQTLKIGELRESVARFKLKATQVLGSGTLTFVASLGGKSGKYSVDLSVRPAAPLYTTTQVGHLPPGGGRTQVAVPRELFAEYRILSAGIAPLPLGLSQGLAQYLEKFPHGCTEQQVSQAIPALVGRARPEFGIKADAAELSFQNIIATLRSRQNDDGGFGLWANPNQVHDFASVYATHFLLEAKERGLPVPPELIKKSQEFLNQLVARETSSLSEERVRAYAVYLLTRSGVVTTQAAMSVRKRLEGQYKNWGEDLAGIYLAATLQLLKQTRDAQRIIGSVSLGQVKDSATDYQNYYDPLIRDAQALYIMARHFPDRVKSLGPDTLLSLVDAISKGRYNTLSSAYLILAFDAYAQLAQDQTDVSQLSIIEVPSSGAQKTLSLPTGLLPQVSFSADARKLLISSSSPLRTFYQVTQSGYDQRVSTDVVKQKLEVLREIVGADGKPIKELKLGEEAEVHIKLRSLVKGSQLYNLAIVDLLPGGFEVVVSPPEESSDSDSDDSDENSRPDRDSDDEGSHEGGDGEGGDGDSGEHESRSARKTSAAPAQLPIVKAGSTWTPEYGDVREDRVVLYGSVGSEVVEFVYAIRATNAGSFAVPPLQGESMYDRSVMARSAGGKIRVVKP